MLLSFAEFLTEADSINPSEYNLQDKYDHFNRLLFGGQLPRIDIAWSSQLSGASGRTNAEFGSNLKVNPEDIKMFISSRFKRSEQQFDAILIHEMTHVYFMYIKNDILQNEGPEFQNMLKSFSQRVGFDVPVTLNTSELNLSDELKPVFITAIVRKAKATGDTQAAFIAPYDWNIRQDEVFKMYEALKNRDDDKYVYSVMQGKTTVPHRYGYSQNGTFTFYKIHSQDVDLLNRNLSKI